MHIYSCLQGIVSQRNSHTINIQPIFAIGRPDLVETSVSYEYNVVNMCINLTNLCNSNTGSTYS